MRTHTQLAIALASLTSAAFAAFAQQPTASDTSVTPAPPRSLIAADHPWDDGTRIDLFWTLSPNDATLVEKYQIRKTSASLGSIALKPRYDHVEFVDPGVNTYTVADLSRTILSVKVEDQFGDRVDQSAVEAADEDTFEIGYLFQVIAVGKDGSKSIAAELSSPIVSSLEWFDGNRKCFSCIVVIFCGSVILLIQMARGGRPLKVRKIAGLEAIDEAVGRATEMGRPCLFIPGIQDMNDIQTIAGINILARVAKTAAEYDAKVEVPTSRSLVMTTARETVQGAYLAAGRPDAYNEDMIYYVTDEQFGYVAYLQGMMVREKPAACFYMGSFYAESLILAETGNGIGAIQVAGTAQPAQLPFFVAACDYTLIGEEFFAASAYLTGTPEELGSLKGQDVGKLIVGIGIIVGVILATTGEVFDVTWCDTVVNFIKDKMLT